MNHMPIYETILRDMKQYLDIWNSLVQYKQYSGILNNILVLLLMKSFIKIYSRYMYRWYLLSKSNKWQQNYYKNT